LDTEGNGANKDAPLTVRGMSTQQIVGAKKIDLWLHVRTGKPTGVNPRRC